MRLKNAAQEDPAALKPQLRGSRGCSASHLVPDQEELSQHILQIDI